MDTMIEAFRAAPSAMCGMQTEMFHSHIAWAKETFEPLRPYMDDRRSVNYLATDDGGFVRQAYGPNHDRLVEVKRRYDPDNTFHLNFNIDPA